MSDNKEYIAFPDENGSINISEEVIASIAAAVTKEQDGVAALVASQARDFAEMFGKKTTGKGVKVRIGQENIAIDIYIAVSFGASVSEVARNVQQSVAAEIEAAVGVDVAAVNVHVAAVI